MDWKPKEIWDQGVALQHAWDEFATPEELAEAARIEDLYQPKNLAMPSIASEIGPIVFNLFNNIQEANRGKVYLKDEFEDRILDYLFNEEIYGFGYPISPKAIRTPRRIDPAFWDGARVDWDEGKAWIEGQSYSRIRLIDPTKFPGLDFQPKSPGPSPENARKIIEAIEFHNAHDGVFWRLTDDERITKLIQTLKDRHGENVLEGRGFSDPSFKAHLLKFKKQKQAQ